jgi:hypothetical protein
MRELRISLFLVSPQHGLNCLDRTTKAPAGHQILRRDIEKYVARPQTSKWVFFDRGLIDALGMLQEVSPMPNEELKALLTKYPFHTAGVHPSALGGDLRQ